ncbi:hypothetical protein GJAV_G00044940 [Gymnothorax javanicus]|nr:hypothetical protein GJAV_G00044940 [Gymnothorax javanicus]
MRQLTNVKLLNLSHRIQARSLVDGWGAFEGGEQGSSSRNFLRQFPQKVWRAVETSVSQFCKPLRGLTFAKGEALAWLSVDTGCYCIRKT